MPTDHGTRACYHAGCRRLACRAANAAYQAQRRAVHRAGLLPYYARLAADQAKAQLRSLRTEGVTPRLMRRICGRVLRVRGRRVSAGTAAEINGLAKRYGGEGRE